MSEASEARDGRSPPPPPKRQGAAGGDLDDDDDDDEGDDEGPRRLKSPQGAGRHLRLMTTMTMTMKG